MVDDIITAMRSGQARAVMKPTENLLKRQGRYLGKSSTELMLHLLLANEFCNDWRKVLSHSTRDP